MKIKTKDSPGINPQTFIIKFNEDWFASNIFWKEWDKNINEYYTKEFLNKEDEEILKKK